VAAKPIEYVVEHVRDAIAKDERLAELHLRVTCVGNRLVITGEVATEERRRALSEVAARVCPDREISNQTAVVPVPEAPKVERLS
jgi:osmotically-inducible protein OsmY